MMFCGDSFSFACILPVNGTIHISVAKILFKAANWNGVNMITFVGRFQNYYLSHRKKSSCKMFKMNKRKIYARPVPKWREFVSKLISDVKKGNLNDWRCLFTSKNEWFYYDYYYTDIWTKSYSFSEWEKMKNGNEGKLFLSFFCVISMK